MCDFCSNSYPEIEVKIDNIMKQITICPNCLARSLSEGTLDIKEGPLFSVLTNKPAVHIQTSDTEINLTPDEAKRYLGHSLYPDEFKKLLELGHSTDEYELHDDFYTEDGLAVQPILSL